MSTLVNVLKKIENIFPKIRRVKFDDHAHVSSWLERHVVRIITKTTFFICMAYSPMKNKDRSSFLKAHLIAILLRSKTTSNANISSICASQGRQKTRLMLSLFHEFQLKRSNLWLYWNFLWWCQSVRLVNDDEFAMLFASISVRQNYLDFCQHHPICFCWQIFCFLSSMDKRKTFFIRIL